MLQHDLSRFTCLEALFRATFLRCRSNFSSCSLCFRRGKLSCQRIPNFFAILGFYFERSQNEIITFSVVNAHRDRSIGRHRHKNTTMASVSVKFLSVHEVMDKERKFACAETRLHQLGSRVPSFACQPARSFSGELWIRSNSGEKRKHSFYRFIAVELTLRCLNKDISNEFFFIKHIEHATVHFKGHCIPIALRVSDQGNIK